MLLVRPSLPATRFGLPQLDSRNKWALLQSQCHETCYSVLGTRKCHAKDARNGSRRPKNAKKKAPYSPVALSSTKLSDGVWTKMTTVRISGWMMRNPVLPEVNTKPPVPSTPTPCGCSSTGNRSGWQLQTWSVIMAPKKRSGRCSRKPLRHAPRAKSSGCNSPRRNGSPARLTTPAGFSAVLSTKTPTMKTSGLPLSSWKPTPSRPTRPRELLATARREAGTDRVWIKSVAFERQLGNTDDALDLSTKDCSSSPRPISFG